MSYVPNPPTPTPNGCPDVYSLTQSGEVVCSTAPPQSPPSHTELPPTGDPLLVLCGALALIAALLVTFGAELVKKGGHR